MPTRNTILLVSGGFDPPHVGHTRLIKAAWRFDPRNKNKRLIAIINNDNWLKRFKKEGLVVIPQEERVEMVEALKGVDEVVLTKHTPDTNDRSVCEVLREVRTRYPRSKIIFCNGGDRTKSGEGEVPELPVCKELGILMRFRVGGGKVQSSSDIVRRIREYW